MAMRELVSAKAASGEPGSSSSSNPLGALANALIGSSSKTQERLQEIPTSTNRVSNESIYEGGSEPALPGSEFDHHPHASSQGSVFLQGFRSSGQDAFANAWDEVQNPQMPLFQGRNNLILPDQIQFQPQLDGPPQRVLSNFLHSFVNSGHRGLPFHPTPLLALGLSEGEKQRIRDRSSIMARHLFADKNEDFVNAQVNALLSSLDIDTDVQARVGPPGRSQEMENVWNDSKNMQNGPREADGWIAEYDQHRVQKGDPNVWAQSFEQLHGANGWASEFENEQSQIASFGQVRGASIPSLAAMEQTRLLAHTLAQNQDPKFQNSKFLQFVSKMSRGEITFEDNQVKSSGLPAPGDWATEYQQQFNGGQSWVDQFEREEFSRGPAGWVNEFTTAREQQGPMDDQWVNEFSKLHVQDWADEFGRQVGEGILGDDSWADTYDEYLNEQATVKQQSVTSKGVYVFSESNPYVGHPQPFQKGQELFREGLLSEAVLALEAEVLKNPDNSEGWRFLGLAHAENDDDQQAIAAMMRAQEADPTNLEVLLALGVSHTNELEQAAALKYLYSWLCHHPKYGTVAPPELSDSLHHADVAKYFSDAAKMSPKDADLHTVLGVLYNLSREYDDATESFVTALELRPYDYSLWNKLGATQANSAQGADAILSYQQALDLKPNYVRAWANMGISYANQGMYDDSIRYYVRALAMNPKADNGWQYLRISLSCASRTDMMEACDSRDLEVLQKEFPL